MASTPTRFLGVGFFIHPIPILAVVLLVVNDHYLKYHFNSWLTGKLSDFAGLFFFPLFLCALLILLLNGVTRRKFGLLPEMLVSMIVLTDLVFIAVKLMPQATALYEDTLGQLGFPSQVTLDFTDLMALSSNILTYLYARQYWQKSSAVEYKLST